MSAELVLQSDHEIEIIKNRSIIQSCFQLSVGEHRLITSCIQIINDRTADNKPIRIHVEQFAKAWNISRQAAHDQLQACTQKLWDRVIYLPTLGKKKGVESIRWIQRKVDYEEGEIELHFSEKIYNELYRIADDSRVPTLLSTMSKFNCQHSHRVYDILLSKRVNEQPAWLWEVTITDFKATLDINESYKRWVDLKKWVIDPVTDEINKHSDLSVTWVPEKQGKSIHRIIFNVVAKTDHKVIGHPVATLKTRISEDFVPHDLSYQALEGKGISREFAESEIPSFILYYSEKNKLSDTWQTLFVTHCLNKWKWHNKQADLFKDVNQPPKIADGSKGMERTLQRLTDRSWAE